MQFLDQKIKELEKRPAQGADSERKRRVALFEHLSVINRFEGLNSTPKERKLFDLYASGKITRREFLDLCTADALSAH